MYDVEISVILAYSRLY